LPFRQASFDVVLLADVIEHLEHAALCVQELRRVLVPGGVALVTTPLGRPDRNPRWNHVKEYTGPDISGRDAGSECIRAASAGTRSGGCAGQ
jgi:ubiquinone/menaquinone biosynthesis C-methylase UbiE